MKNYSDEDVLRYVDGDMSDADATELRNHLVNDSELNQRVEAMLASQLPYSEAFEAYPAPAMPDSVRQAMTTLAEDARNSDAEAHTPLQTRESKYPKMKIAAAVAALGVSFLFGFGAANLNTNTNPLVVSNSQTSNEVINEDLQWALRVAEYQTLYVPETVKDTIDGREKAIELLSQPALANRMDTQIPDLTSVGYQFVRAQQLGYKGEPLIQLLYTGPDKNPLALCYMPSPGGENNDISAGIFEGLSRANWRTSDQRFVIVANESLQSIEAIAHEARKTFL